ncbi:dimethylargininase [Streptomyces sp. NPDC089919]|uniref:dimethylargininase n=1 Tax=Streptomyces sp. NPDC089919 TaxID=3155188 RepID=UPI00341A873F
MTVRRPARVARPRHYLMCRPTYFTVDYAINPWMNPADATDTDLAIRQWQQLHDLYLELGHTVDLIAPQPDLPDMVYTANGATVIADRALVARFRHTERAAESQAFLDWFGARGYQDVAMATQTNEGEGDYLLVGERVLAGSGFRTAPAAHAEAERMFGLPVVGLTLVDPRFYHLDTALSVLDRDQIMYYPEAFSAESRETLRALYPEAILATDEDAQVFGLNAVSDGRRVVLPAAATALADRLADHGFDPIGMDLSELLKGGGSVKCCTLELRHRP